MLLRWRVIRGKSQILRHRILHLAQRGVSNLQLGTSCFFSSSCSVLSEHSSPSLELDLSEYFLSKRDWRKAPKCPDYIGPICIKRTADGRGRGVFATRKVDKGELVLIGNPIASSQNDTNRVELFAKICVALRESPWALHRFSLLARGDDQQVKEIPPIELFDPRTPYTDSQDAGNLISDSKRIFEIMLVNSFGASLYSADGEPTTKIDGMYLLPSLINHSCCRNASRTFVAEAMVVSAARDIQADEEITVEYTDGLLPLKKRRSLLDRSGHGFRCQCKRCEIESSVQDQLEEHSECFMDLHEKAYEEIKLMLLTRKPFPFSSCKKLAAAFDEVKRKTDTFDHLSRLEKQWILGGFSSAFLGKWFTSGLATGFTPPSQFVSPIATEVLEARRATVSGVPHTLSFAMLLSSIAQQRDLELSSKFLEIARDECLAVYGKQKADVLTKLTMRGAEIAPY